jgi:hypothetical protein
VYERRAGSEPTQDNEIQVLTDQMSAVRFSRLTIIKVEVAIPRI